jgi:hypothetical protein
MSWYYVGQSSAADTAGTGDIVLTEPSGVRDGDLLVACIALRGNATVGVPSGWTSIAYENSGNELTSTSGIAGGMMVYRVRGSSALTLTERTFTRSGGGTGCAGYGRIVAYRGQAASSILDVSISITAAAGTAVSVAGLTTTAADDLLVAMVAYGDNLGFTGLGSTDPPARPTGDEMGDLVATSNLVTGVRDRWRAGVTGYWREIAESTTSSGADTGLGIWHAKKITAGATGTISGTHLQSARHVMIVAAFKVATTPTGKIGWGECYTAEGAYANDKTVAVTIGGESNRMVIAAVTLGNMADMNEVGGSTLRGATFNGIAMTEVYRNVNSGGQPYGTIWYAIKEADLPSAGTYNLVITADTVSAAYSNFIVQVIPFHNVNQSAWYEWTTEGADWSVAAHVGYDVTITTAESVAVFAMWREVGGAIADTMVTLHQNTMGYWNHTGDGGDGLIAIAHYPTTGATVGGIGWTYNAGGTYGGSLLMLNPATGGGGTPVNGTATATSISGMQAADTPKISTATATMASTSAFTAATIVVRFGTCTMASTSAMTAAATVVGAATSSATMASLSTVQVLATRVVKPGTATMASVSGMTAVASSVSATTSSATASSVSQVTAQAIAIRRATATVVSSSEMTASAVVIGQASTALITITSNMTASWADIWFPTTVEEAIWTPQEVSAAVWS